MTHALWPKAATHYWIVESLVQTNGFSEIILFHILLLWRVSWIVLSSQSQFLLLFFTQYRLSSSTGAWYQLISTLKTLLIEAWLLYFLLIVIQLGILTAERLRSQFGKNIFPLRKIDILLLNHKLLDNIISFALVRFSSMFSALSNGRLDGWLTNVCLCEWSRSQLSACKLLVVRLVLTYDFAICLNEV